MNKENECLTDNSQFNRNVACKNCVLRPKEYLNGKPIPEEDRYNCGFCQIYKEKPIDIALHEADCKYKTEA